MQESLLSYELISASLTHRVACTGTCRSPAGQQANLVVTPSRKKQVFYGARPAGSPAVSHEGARLVATANEIAAVTDVVPQVPHKVSFVSSSKTANSSTRSSVRVGVQGRSQGQSDGQGQSPSHRDGPIKLQPGLC